MVVILVLLTVLFFLTLDYIAQQRVAPVSARAPAGPGAADLLDAPGGLFWAPWHAWAQLEPCGTLRVGAGRLPLAALGTADAVEVVAPGSAVCRGDPVARLRRGEREIHLRSPASGVVEAVHPTLGHQAAALESDPFGAGWLCVLRPTNLSDAVRSLRVADEARTWMRSELGRLRDYLAAVRHDDPALAPTLADGGLPQTGLAGFLDEREWHELVQQFFAAPIGNHDPDAGSRA